MNQQKITRELIKANPSITFIYGTSLYQEDYSGQAAVCIGEKNTIGFPTKKRTCRTPKSDNFFYDNEALIFEALFRGTVASIKKKEKVYVIPKIGEGCSQLSTKAPILFHWLARELNALTNRIYEL